MLAITQRRRKASATPTRCEIGTKKTYRAHGGAQESKIVPDLLELASKLQLAVEASQMGVWEFDEQTGRVHWDDRMLEIYGISDGLNERPDDFWETHLHPDDLEATKAYAERCKRENTDFKRDYRIIREDGSVRHIRSMARSVVSPGRPSRLIGVNFDVTKDYLRAEQLQKAQRQLQYDARHDALTGLGNRRQLDELTLALFNRLSDTDRYCVMHLDVDHFKQVNDTLGHLAGDHVLAALARILQRVVGGLGTSFRVGGDEFVVLFETAPSDEEVEALCAELVAQMSAPITYGGEDCSVSISIGYAFGQGRPDNPSQVFVHADAALYAVKFNGRSGYRAHCPSLTAVAASASTARREILNAIGSEQLICFYQPQYDAHTLEIIGAEALVRWDCPKRGILTPDAFLPQAEAAGLIAEIDASVFKIVARQQTDWTRAGLSFPVVSVNTSMARLSDPNLIASVRAQLSEHHKISLELLETAFLDTMDDAVARNLSAMRDLGLRIELDDFGSGHSSVAALQAIKPDQVKIDRSLIAPLESNPNQIQMLQSLSRIARLEDATVAIEGLETGLQLAAIRRVDCDVLQGFALQRPMHANDLAALLTRSDAACHQRGASA